jgi:hypothetical protein
MRFPEDAMKSHTSLAYHLRTLYARHAGDPAATRAARPPTRDRVIHKNGEVSSVSDEAIAVAAMRELRGIAAERGDDGTAGTRSTPKRQQKRPAAAAASPPDPDAYDARIEAEELRAARGEARLCAYEGTVEWDAPPRPGDYAHQARSIHWFPYDRVGVVDADP